MVCCLLPRDSGGQRRTPPEARASLADAIALILEYRRDISEIGR